MVSDEIALDQVNSRHNPFQPFQLSLGGVPDQTKHVVPAVDESSSQT
jgi:hypothetical protein